MKLRMSIVAFCMFLSAVAYGTTQFGNMSLPTQVYSAAECDGKFNQQLTFNLPIDTTSGVTNSITLADKAYNYYQNFDTNTVLKIEFPPVVENHARKFYLVLSCTEETAGAPSLLFNTDEDVSFLLPDGDATVFSTKVGVNVYKFEEVLRNKFIIVRTVGVEL